MNIYLIRHSKQLKICGTKNIHEKSQSSNEKIILSVEGEEKAKEISNLKDLENIKVLWSSNYVRAISTAKYISHKNNIDINIDSRLNERKIGDLKEFEKLGKGKNITFTDEQLINKNFKNLDGESNVGVTKRMNEFFQEILNKDNIFEDIAVVNHGASIKFYLSQFCKINDKYELVYNDKILNISSPCVLKLKIKDKKIQNIIQIY